MNRLLFGLFFIYSTACYSMHDEEYEENPPAAAATASQSPIETEQVYEPDDDLVTFLRSNASGSDKRITWDNNVDWEGAIHHARNPSTTNPAYVEIDWANRNIMMFVARAENTTYGHTGPFRTNYKFHFGYTTYFYKNGKFLLRKDHHQVLNLRPGKHHKNTYKDEVLGSYRFSADIDDIKVARAITKITYRN